MERLEGKVLGRPEEVVAFYARLAVGEQSLRREQKQVRFTVMLDDGSHVRVRARSPRIGPSETLRGSWSEVADRVPGRTFTEAGLVDDSEVDIRGCEVRAGDRVALEGALTWGKTTDGYRGASARVPVAIDAIAIGVGDDAMAFLDDEVERRKRAAFLEEMGTLRKLGLRGPLRTLGIGALLVLTAMVLDLLDLPIAATRYFVVITGLLLALAALLFIRDALGWTRGGGARSGALGLMVVVGVIAAMMGLDVAGGAASHARIGMATVPLFGLGLVWMTRHRPSKARDSHRWAHRMSLGALIGVTALGAFFVVRNIAQDHYDWEARVVRSDRPDIAVGDTCEISVAYGSRGFMSPSAQCQTELECGGQVLYGESQGFVRCERSGDGFHGADHVAYDGDGVITLDGTSGHSGGVVFEGPPFER